MAADPPEDPFDGIEDLIETSPPQPAMGDWIEREDVYVRTIRSAIVLESALVERDRLLHELRRSLAETHPLEGGAILSRIEAMLLREPGAAMPLTAACPHCGIALRVVDRPSARPVDPAERAGLLASAAKSLKETRSEPAAVEALARELARVDVVMTRGQAVPCPLCRYLLAWPDGV